jgi:predicted lipoprotein with Yx(FWY)xxD motif
MGFTRRAVLGSAATIGVAGCVGGGDDGADEATESPTDGAMDTQSDEEMDTQSDEEAADSAESPSDTTAPTDDQSATVVVRSHEEIGEILVDAEGMTLYMFDQDTQGEGASTCSGDCADAWPPLTTDGSATGGDNVTAEVGTFERSDGEVQVAANGWPLYYFAADESPGDMEGQGVNDVWWVLTPDGMPVRSTPAATETETAAATETEERGGGPGGY